MLDRETATNDRDHATEGDDVALRLAKSHAAIDAIAAASNCVAPKATTTKIDIDATVESIAC